MPEVIVGCTDRRHDDDLPRLCKFSGLADRFLISINDIVTGLGEFIYVIGIVRDPDYLISPSLSFFGNDIFYKITIGAIDDYPVADLKDGIAKLRIKTFLISAAADENTLLPTVCKSIHGIEGSVGRSIDGGVIPPYSVKLSYKFDPVGHALEILCHIFDIFGLNIFNGSANCCKEILHIMVPWDKDVLLIADLCLNSVCFVYKLAVFKISYRIKRALRS